MHQLLAARPDLQCKLHVFWSGREFGMIFCTSCCDSVLAILPKQGQRSVACQYDPHEFAFPAFQGRVRPAGESALAFFHRFGPQKFKPALRLGTHRVGAGYPSLINTEVGVSLFACSCPSGSTQRPLAGKKLFGSEDFPWQRSTCEGPSGRGEAVERPAGWPLFGFMSDQQLRAYRSRFSTSCD